MRHIDIKQGELENLILNAVWKLELDGQSRVYVSGVLEHIQNANRNWAYTTVKTVMDRLVAKELLNRTREGKRFYYGSAQSREVAGKEALQKLMRQYFLNDIDELQGCIAQLRQEGVGIQPASPMSREHLERSFNTPAITATL
jgi:predicted transcriptional regulator